MNRYELYISWFYFFFLEKIHISILPDKEDIYMIDVYMIFFLLYDFLKSFKRHFFYKNVS